MQIILCRHGETEWSLSGKHTSVTNLALTAKGEMQAKALGQKLQSYLFKKAYTSPLRRAYDTCKLALSSEPIIEPNATEWNYGTYEGVTTPEIWQKNPTWNLFRDGAPGGESPEDVAKRADLLIERFCAAGETVVLFSHGHFLRVFAARWIGLDPLYARSFALSVSSVSLLGFERTERVISLWNQV
jgi:probable phosphoglycerate mutase